MKIIDLHGIPNLEPVQGSAGEWYWATDYIHGDLYEAEELFRQGHPVQSNRLYLIHYPDGTVYEPVPPAAGQYFGGRHPHSSVHAAAGAAGGRAACRIRGEGLL